MGYYENALVSKDLTANPFIISKNLNRLERIKDF